MSLPVLLNGFWFLYHSNSLDYCMQKNYFFTTYNLVTWSIDIRSSCSGLSWSRWSSTYPILWHNMQGQSQHLPSNSCTSANSCVPSAHVSGKNLWYTFSWWKKAPECFLCSCYDHCCLSHGHYNFGEHIHFSIMGTHPYIHNSATSTCLTS